MSWESDNQDIIDSHLATRIIVEEARVAELAPILRPIEEK
jgi:hypothetical protein